MSMKDCVVLVYPKDQPPYVVSDKGEFFSKKEAQRQATAHIKNGGDILKAEVFSLVQVVRPTMKPEREYPKTLGERIP